MSKSQPASIHQFLRSSQEIFDALGPAEAGHDEEVATTIDLIERASDVIYQLVAKTNELESAIVELQQEVAELRTRDEESAQRVALAEEAMVCHTDRADRAERLLSLAYEKANRLEKRNQELSAQLDRLVNSVSSSLTLSKFVPCESKAADLAA